MTSTQPSNPKKPASQSDKAQLRIQARQARAAIPKESKKQHSTQIIASLFNYLNQHAPADYRLLAYRSLADEVDTSAIFNIPSRPPSCTIYAPRMHGRDDMHWLGANADTQWKRGAFGIPEPQGGPDWMDETSPTILICPLVGFDRSGNRLGMGKGCFDRWLSTHQHRITEIIGIAFACQELATIPSEPHDIPLHTIITEKEIITCRTL